MIWLVRAALLVAVLVLIAGCSSRSAEEDALLDQATVDTLQRGEFEQRLARELEAGRERRAAALAGNRRALDRFPLPRGVELVLEEHQGEEPEERAEADLEFWLWVDGRMEYEDGLVAKAADWITYRHYRLPEGTTTIEAHDVYAQPPGGWNAGLREAGDCGPGPRWPCYALDFERAARCVWVHIGYFQGPVEPRRALIVATDVC